MARLLEHDALALFAKGGIPEPEYAVAGTAAEAELTTRDLGGRAVIKALIPAGGRGKAGAIKLVGSPEDAREFAAGLLGATVANFPVERLLVSAAVDIAREIFVSITFDSMTRGPVVLVSALGGIDIEEILSKDPDSLIQTPVKPSAGLTPGQAQDIAERAGLNGDTGQEAARIFTALDRVFRDLDAQIVEINPLAVTADGGLVAPTGVIVIDDQALARHPELDGIANPNLTNGWRPLTALERRMREIDATDEGSAIRFNEFPDGDIAFMFTGGGAGFLAFDALKRLGGKPATTFDITPGFVEEKMYLATKAILARRGLKGLLAGGNITNFIPIDIKVRGVMRALKELAIDPGTFPIVFRYAGPGSDAGRAAAAELPGIEYFGAEASIEDAVARIVELTRGP